MYVIAFRLTGPPERYEALDNALKALGPWSNRLEKAWLVESPFSSRRIRDLLKPHVDIGAGDRVFVGQITQNWAATGMGSQFPEWIQRRNFGEQPAS